MRVLSAPDVAAAAAPPARFAGGVVNDKVSPVYCSFEKYFLQGEGPEQDGACAFPSGYISPSTESGTPDKQRFLRPLTRKGEGHFSVKSPGLVTRAHPCFL